MRPGGLTFEGLDVVSLVGRKGFSGRMIHRYKPSLANQHERMESFTAPFTVLRLLTPLKISYEAAKKRAEPYNKIVGELPDMRKETVMLIKDVIGHNRRAYVLMENRLEGDAPLTVQALTDLLMTES